MAGRRCSKTGRCFITWRDLEAEVDPEIFETLARWSWNAFTTRTAGKVYFRRGGGTGRLTILLHREVMRLWGLEPPAPGLIVDHRDGNELDCRRRNLRWVTYRENTLNRRKPETRKAAAKVAA